MSFKHRGYLAASKKPKLPTLFRVRKDLTWEEVVTDWREKAPKKTGTFPILDCAQAHTLISAPSLLLINPKKRRKKGFWQDVNNRREFLCDLARQLGFDPYQVENWNKVPNRELIARGVTLSPHS